MIQGILVGVGGTLVLVFILWLFYATGVEMERKRNRKAVETLLARFNIEREDYERATDR